MPGSSALTAFMAAPNTDCFRGGGLLAFMKQPTVRCENIKIGEGEPPGI